MNGTGRIAPQEERLAEARQALQSAHGTLQSGNPVQALQVEPVRTRSIRLIQYVLCFHLRFVYLAILLPEGMVSLSRTFYASHGTLGATKGLC